jgi:hypothetical protein
MMRLSSCQLARRLKRRPLTNPLLRKCRCREALPNQDASRGQGQTLSLWRKSGLAAAAAALSQSSPHPDAAKGRLNKLEPRFGKKLKK